MRCTVDGLTPSRSAMTRMPGRPGVARASRIRFSSAGACHPRRDGHLGLTDSGGNRMKKLTGSQLFGGANEGAQNQGDK